MSVSSKAWNMVRSMFAEPAPFVSDTQKRICSELNNRGIAIMPIRELIPEDRYALVKNQAIEFSTGSKVSSGIDYYKANYGDPSWAQKGWAKDYLVTKFKVDDVVPFTDPLLQLAVSPELLDTVNLYLGLYSRLNQLNYWYTIPLSEPDRTRVASQNWHHDPEDRKLVKIFIYYTAVDESAGPLEYILKSRPGERYDKMWPGGGYPPPDQVEQHVPTIDRVVARGPEGTIIFCDTSGLHRGALRWRRRAFSACSRTFRLLYHTTVSAYSHSTRLRSRPDSGRRWSRAWRPDLSYMKTRGDLATTNLILSFYRIDLTSSNARADDHAASGGSAFTAFSPKQACQ
jgi:hypothetical protein